ncbi:MAG: hypothetical protein ACRDT6_16105 [Micromonosporaceae bacterium]
MTNGLVNSSDLYRAALVQGVAALDRYVHGVVLDLGVEILLGRRPAVSSSRVGMSLKGVAALINTSNPAVRELAARSILAERLGAETFQRPDDIANAMAMVGIKAIWSKAFANAEQAKIAVGVIVNRRNKIVHQCDYDPATLGAISPISVPDILDALDVIDITIKTIDPHCS